MEISRPFSSPPLDKPVKFYSPFMRLQLHVAREGLMQLSDGGGHMLPATVVVFEGGQYQTDDPDIVRWIRQTPAYKRGEVFEIKDPGQKPPFVPPAQTVVRGGITSVTLQGEAPKKENPFEKKPISVEEKPPMKGTMCEECGKKFPDDLTGSKLRGHMLAHRKKIIESRNKD